MPDSLLRREAYTLAGLVAVSLFAGIYAVFFGWLSLRSYHAYEMHALDMGNMGQAAWNTVHGHPFYFTNMRLPYHIEAWNTTTRLSFHVEALFPIISLVYLIYPGPESLLILQTLAIAVGAIPVYLLGREILNSVWLGIVFALAYLLFPSLEAMNLYEFHPVALATPLLLFAFLFARRRQYLPFLLCATAAMGTKEEIGLVVAMFGLYVAFVNRDWAIGFLAAAAGAAWSLLAALVIERHFRQPGTLTYMHTRYGYLGHGVHSAINTVLHHPGAILGVLFIWPKFGYLVRLLAPVGFTPLAVPYALLLGAPTFALNLLSDDPHMYSGFGDNSAELIAVVMIAGVLGARLLLGLLERRLLPGGAAVVLGAGVLAFAGLTQHADGFTPIGNRFHVPDIGYHQRVADRFIAMIPSGVPVSTQDQLDPHLSSRHYLYLFNDTGRILPPLPPADLVLLDVSAPTYPLPSYQLHEYATQLIRSKGWGVAAAQNGLILIKHGDHNRKIPAGFYSYARADGARFAHPLFATISGLRLLGYDVSRVDQSNHPVPNLAYTLYLRPERSHLADLQPVLFETMDGKLMGCTADPLGLAWFPTTRWSQGHTYVMRIATVETQSNTPGTARFFVEIRPTLSPSRSSTNCAALWAGHGRLVPAGSLDVVF